MGVTFHSAFGDEAGAQTWREDAAAAAEFQRARRSDLVMTFDPGYRVRNGEVEIDAARTVEGLSEVVDRLGPLGVRVGLENWINAPGPELFRACCERIADQLFGMLLDVGHLKIILAAAGAGPAGVEDYLAAIPLPIWEVHVHDNDGKLDQHRPPADGEWLGRVLRCVRRRGDGPTLTVEAKPEKGAWNLEDAAQLRALGACLACVRSAGRA